MLAWAGLDGLAHCPFLFPPLKARPKTSGRPAVVLVGTIMSAYWGCRGSNAIHAKLETKKDEVS